MKKCYLYTVSGRVQGVGFRYFIYQKSKLFKIDGYVKNLPTGEVEVLVIGEEEDINIFEKYINSGPAGANVINVDKQELKKIPLFNGFEIRY